MSRPICLSSRASATDRLSASGEAPPNTKRYTVGHLRSASSEALVLGEITTPHTAAADEPAPPCLETASKRALKKLTKNPSTGENWTAADSLTANTSVFQPLSLGVFSYMSVLRQWLNFYGVVLLLSISSMVSNAYGHMLDKNQISFQTFLFTFTSLGNSDSLQPAYGATELTITCMLTVFLYWSTWKLRVMSRRAERLQITPADFAVMVEDLPKVGGEKITAGLEEALADPKLFERKSDVSTRLPTEGEAPKPGEAPEPGEAPKPGTIVHIGVAMSQRSLIRWCREYEGIGTRLSKQLEALAALDDCAHRGIELSPPAAARRSALKLAVDKARTEQHDLAVRIRAKCQSGAIKNVDPRDVDPRRGSDSRKPGKGRRGGAAVEFDLNRVSVTAGTAFVSFTKASDALALIRRQRIRVKIEMTDVWGRENGATYYDCRVSRPAEPSDVIWENLECKDSWLRQLQGTLGLTLLALGGTIVISLTSFAQPHALESAAAAGGLASQLVGLFGTVLVVAGYLVVFLVVPQVEDKFMRHRTVTQKEVSTVLKLVFFQVLATIATATVFVLETGGSFNREWYLTGGFILINGMIVDLGFITCVVQGWNLGVQISRRVVAPHALTQYEADEAFAVKADGYVTDRLQMVTKFVVMTYIYSSAMPLLWAIVVAVLLVSQFFDSRNLLRVFQPPPQSDESAVKAILVYVMPLAVLGHLVVSYVMLHAMQDKSTDDWWASMKLSMSKIANVTAWGQQIGDTVANANAALQIRANTGFLNVSQEVLGAFGQPEDDAVDMVWLSVLINGPLVLCFIMREWGREWGKELPADLLLKAPGTVLTVSGNAVQNVACCATQLIPGGKIRAAMRSEIEHAAHEAGALYTAIDRRFDEDAAWKDEETARRLEEADAKEEIEFRDMIKAYTKKGFARNDQLFYAPPDYTDLITRIALGDEHQRPSNGALQNRQGTPIKDLLQKGRSPSSSLASGKFMV